MLQPCGRIAAMIALHLQAASKQDQAALDNLMQLYTYDWSELGPLDVGENGRFEDYPLDAYWEDPWRHPFLLRVDGKLAGFALVAARSRLTGADGVFDMAEFFVMRRYRRRGIGQAAAIAAFEQLRGSWEIRQREDNVEATAFWRRVIGRYTGGKYQELHWNDATWTGPVQRFSNQTG
jgi:predicted acetyltransferase